MSGSALGLVYSSTSGTAALPVLARAEARAAVLRDAATVVDRHASRLRRMSHGVKTASRLLSEQLGRSGFRHKPAMVTLTYREARDWQGGHVAYFLRHVRQYLERKGHRIRYVWVAELQERGAIHYHVLLWLPVGLTLPKPDKRGWWPHGSTRIEWARRAVGYLAKYASKGQGMDAHQLPRGARISGHGGLDQQARVEFRFWRAPSEAREFFGLGADIRRITGGRVNRITGEFWESPWIFARVGGRNCLLRRTDVAAFLEG